MDGNQRAGESSVELLRQLYKFMAARWFVAGRAELVEAGFRKSRIDSWSRSGRIVKLFRAVYSYSRDVECREAVWRAALVAAGPASALCGLSACEAWGIVEPRQRLPRRVDVAVGSGASRCLRGRSPALRQTTVRIVKRNLSPGDIQTINGLALTSPALALIDFAECASEREVRFAFLEACRLRRFGRQDVRLCYQRVANKRGASKLRPLLALWVPELKRIRSVLEGQFLLAWIERGLEMPKVNVRVSGYEVDLYWPQHGVVLELDGDAFHSDPVQRGIDAEKQKHLESEGLIVFRVTYRGFMGDPEGTITAIAVALGLH